MRIVAVVVLVLGVGVATALLLTRDDDSEAATGNRHRPSRSCKPPAPFAAGEEALTEPPVDHEQPRGDPCG